MLKNRIKNIPPRFLTTEFYTREDVVQVSKDLLGKALVTGINGVTTSGIIVETEAYKGPEDKAAHSHGNRRTPRTEVMFWQGGVTYVYLCYGIHHLMNVVTGREGQPHAVLIRAVEPLEGIGQMLERRKLNRLLPRITAGPGSLSEALGIKTNLTGKPLNSPEICILDHGIEIAENEIIESPRVGVAYAGDHALWPWRFRVKDNKYTSPAV